MARVLVVDDDPDILKVVERVLRMQEHEVYTAQDAMKAMGFLNASVYDLLITDANMPSFSGFELARTVKNNKKFQKMAICMLTGLREKKDIEKAIRAGVDGYIVKPIDPILLLQKVSQIFEKKPPANKVEFEFGENLQYTMAQISVPARISKLNESGFTLRACVDIPESMVVTISSLLFRRLEISKPPQTKVLASRRVVEFDYEIEVAFVGINDSFRKRIREWIEKQSVFNGKAA